MQEEAQHAQHGAVQGSTDLHTSQQQLDRAASASPTQQQQQHGSSVQRDDSSIQLFQRPGHEIVSVVWEDDSLVGSQQHELPAAARLAVHAEHALHAEQNSVHQGSCDEHDEQLYFADGCRRLVAVIEVG